MLTRIATALFAAFLAVTPAPLLAQADVAVPADAASYGPIMVCIGNYAVRVNEGEAARRTFFDSGRVEQLTLIGNRAGTVAFRTGAIATTNRQYERDDVTLPSGVVAARYSFARWEGYREGIPGEAVFSTEPAHREYQLPAADGHQPVMALAEEFSSRDSKSDMAILSRVVPRTAADCATLEAPAAPGAEPSAAVFTPQTVVGPTTFCSGQLGIALREGERVRIFWPFDPRIAPVWILQDDRSTMQLSGGPPIGRRVPSGPFLQAGYIESRYSDGSGSAWQSRNASHAYGDGSPLTLYISFYGASQAHVDAVMNRLAFYSNGRGCDVQAMPAP